MDISRISKNNIYYYTNNKYYKISTKYTTLDKKIWNSKLATP